MGKALVVDPDPHDQNVLAAFVEDRLDDDERRYIIGHLAGCADCRGTVAMLARGSVTQAHGVSDVSPRRWRQPMTWLGVAATIAIATVASVLVLRSRAVDVKPDAAPRAQTAPQPSASPAPPAVAPSTPPFGEATTREPAGKQALGAVRGAEKRVGGRRFRLEAGMWVDTAFDPLALLPVVDVTTATDRDAILRAHPALTPFAALGPRVTVVFQRTVYRFDVR